MPGTLHVVATPIGNLEDISARALRVLREATLIAAEDTRRTKRLLARYAIVTPTTSLHEHNERAKAASLVDRLLRGDNIALVSDAGTPLISDPGHRLIQAAIEAGLRVEPIPGPSAVLAALVVSGLFTNIFTFVGFPPARGKDRTGWFNDLRHLSGTVVFFESPHRIRRTLEQLKDIVGDCQICVARELTKIHEELVRGPIYEVLDRLQAPRGEFAVVAKIGCLTENTRPEAESADTELLSEFGQLTDYKGIGRRQAIAELARRHSRAPNDVYKALERARKLV